MKFEFNFITFYNIGMFVFSFYAITSTYSLITNWDKFEGALPIAVTIMGIFWNCTLAYLFYWMRSNMIKSKLESDTPIMDDDTILNLIDEEKSKCI